MNTEHIHTLIASNKELSQNYARVIKTNARAIKLIDNCLQEKDRLEATCFHVYQWLDDKKNPTEREKHWKRQLEKVLKIKGH